MHTARILLALTLGIAGATALVVGSRVHAEEANLTAKLQQMVGELTPEQQSALLLLLSQLRQPATEAPAKEMTAEDSINAGLAEFKTAQEKNEVDLDGLMSHVSEDFYHPGVGDKKALREWAEAMLPMIDGMVEDIDISVEDTEYEMDGDEVEIYPIDIATPLGSITIGLYAQRDSDGVWRVTGADGV